MDLHVILIPNPEEDTTVSPMECYSSCIKQTAVTCSIATQVQSDTLIKPFKFSHAPLLNNV